MARKDRDNKGHSGTTDTIEGSSTLSESSPETGSIEPPSTESTINANLGNDATVETSTGEMNGSGYESQAVPDIDVVHMPKKLVAKDIVGRTALKCKKIWVPQRDKDGNPMSDSEGNPLGTHDVSPPRALYLIFGTANGTRTGTTSYGDWTSFLGTFEAVRHEDGARFASNEAILQEPAQSLLMEQLGEVKKRDPSGSVGFSFEIGVQTSQRWVDTGEGSSYAFTVKSIFNVSKHDPLAAMRRALVSHIPPPKPKQLTIS